MDELNLQNNIEPAKPSFWAANPHLKMLLLILVVVFLFSGIALAAIPILQKQYRQKIYEQTVAGLPKHQVKEIVLADGRLQVDSPKEGDTVGQTFGVSGYAQGWFEGTIVIKVFDASSTLLYQGNAIAGDNYGHPAPFQIAITLTATPTTPTGRIEFDDYSAKDGSLVYQKVLRINFTNFNSATIAPVIVGGDKDSHGCIGSAGYTWCEAKNKCLRIWEEKCE